ncbi:Putative esterase [Marivirga sericea]|uniref:Putative esterase n=1 Tax=Marivirga sericea TaxID=1028 RepID=A0A1X7K7F8_9BACT|nr:alpha/beta hydrolase-fold protein [Marivirga sericea]SMG36224.1 Putative esterase [Marivirga sericea]
MIPQLGSKQSTMNIFLSILILILASPVLCAQARVGSSVLDYKVYNLQSEHFPGQQRTVKIYLPEYYDSLKKYPVLYTLDGNTLFNITSSYVSHLSKLTIDDDGYDYGSDVIPEAIVVGIFHNDRGYETTPNVSEIPNSDETIYREGSQRLKDFIFKEVLPFVDSKFSTSGYNAIIGHSNTAHFVMSLPFQKNNPFRGIISLSLGGYSDTFKNKVTSFLKANQATQVFIGYGSKDFEFKELAQHLEGNVENKKLKVMRFNANHNEMPAISLSQGLKFLFNEYRNISDFARKSTAKDFDVNDYLREYEDKNNEAYGINTKMKEDDFYSLIEMSIESKNKKVFNQLIDYETKVHGYTQQTHMLFIYNKKLGDYKKAMLLAKKMLESQDDLDQRILKANLMQYYSFFMNDLTEDQKAINFFQEGKNKFADAQLEFSYFIAKACLENNVNKELGDENLAYCFKHFEENRYFRKSDLKSLSEK